MGLSEPRPPLPLAPAPTHEPDPHAWDRLLETVAGRRIVVLAGAGCSTESGIPDYRGTGAPRRRAPVQYQEFVRTASARARYWARSTIGWPRIRAARPNAGHLALARMEAAGHVAGVITQNVDGLHHAAGSTRVVELHGSLAAVCCIDCGAVVTRDAFQQRLLERNAAWLRMPHGAGVVNGDGTAMASAAAPAAAAPLASEPSAVAPLASEPSAVAPFASAPDGDAELPDTMLACFIVPECEACAGIMKPDVVFFGENVPARVVGDAWTVFEAGDVLLVTGSSLAVFSGRRFVYRASRDGVPIAIINRGPTRADDVATARVDGALGTVLPALADALGA